MEGGKGVAEKKGTNEEVVLQIQGNEDSKSPSPAETSSGSFLKNFQFGSSPKSVKDQNIEVIELDNLKNRVQMSTFSSSPSPVPSPSSNKPPKIPTDTLTRRKSLARSVFSKPKSRFVEPAYVGEATLTAEKTQLVNTNTTSISNRNSPNVASPSHKVGVSTPRDHLKSAPITPKTPLIGSPGGEEEDDEEVYKIANLKVREKNGIWLVKNLLVKLLASSFQCTRFFDRIQESIFHQYVLKTLSGPPLMEMAEKVGSTASTGHLSLRNLKEKAEAKEEIVDVDKLKKMKQEKISAWTMKGLINVIRSSGLSTISNSLDNFDDDDGEQKDEEITSEWQAKAAAYGIFNNVAKPGSKYIDEEDLLRFMKKEEVDNVLPLFEGAAETGKIKRKSLKNWLVNVYLERKSLAHSLNDTKTAIEELNRLVSVIVLIVDIIVCLLLMGFLTTQILVFISSQLLLVVFLFGNTAKTVFEAIIFVFVMHPFDVGDRCVVDGVQMTVEEMNILTTIFLRYDNEKIFYPNSVLSTKPISNFYRSPEMSDSIEFAVDVSTSIESIKALKARIKTYLESKPQHWRPGHNVIVKEIENVNKMKMALIVTHTINFQNYGDRNSRRSELILELKKNFEELGIKYQLLPQEVHLRYVGSAPPAFQP
uniref:Mechanosensitive ion channel MscS domain-containing protein n=1 Tax=Fagus sylvatica TaxID=28930 RepID=A0A2N9GW28_FAGSY